MSIKFLSGVNVDSNTLFVDAANDRVGIGTASPGAKLEVDSGSTLPIIRARYNATYYADYDSNGIQFVGAGQNFNITDNGSSVLYLKSGGNVGIGTTSPTTAKLVISQTGGTQLHLISGDSSGSTDVLIRLTSSIDYRGRGILMDNSGASGSWYAGVPYTGGSYSIGYGTTQPEYLANSKFFINTSGNVGIGTTSPSQKLTVIGTFAAYSAIGSSDNVRTGIAHYDTTAQAEGVGGQLVLGYKYIADTDYTEGAIIKMYKENGTSGEYGSGLKFQVRNTGANLSTKVTINPSGNVGIGTTAPDSLLHISGSGNTFTRYTNTTSAGHYIDIGANSAGQSFVYGYGAYPLLFATNGSEAMRITSAGNVGIGTASPTTKLEVGNFLDAVTNKITVAARYEYEPEFNFRLGQSGTGYDWIGAVISSGDDGNYNGKILFKTANAGRDTPTAKMIIKANGNVGIGTTAPVSKLQVNHSSAPSFNANGGANALTLVRTGGRGTAGTFGAGLVFSQPYLTDDASIGVGGIYGVKINGSGTFGGGLAFFAQPNSAADMFEVMRITSAGNVGIGTTAPVGILHLYKAAAAARLAIDGDAGQNRLISYRTGALQRFGLYVNNTAESGSNAGSNFAIRAYSDAGTLLSTPFFINRATGDVGIGTTSPGYKLDVSGDINFSNTLKFAGTTVLSNSGTDVYANLRVIRSKSTIADGMYINYDSDGGANADIRFFADGQSERMRIDASNGNVGIGTTSPTYKLSVEESTTNPIAYFGLLPTNASSRNSLIILQSGTIPQSGSDTTGEVGFLFKHSYGTGGVNGTANGGYIESIRESVFGITSQVNTALIFGTSAANTDNERMRITSAGNVGIGTTSPTTKLVVESGGFAVQGASSWPTSGFGLEFWNAGTTSYIGAYNRTTSAYRDMFLFANDTIFENGGSQRMRITSAGNVGIGTTAPGSKLNVTDGFIRVNGTDTDQYFLEGVRTGVSTTLRIYDNSSIPFYDSYSSMVFRANQNGGSGGYIGLQGGNVGIGTTNPDVFSRGYSGKILGISSSGQSAIQLNAATGNAAYFDMGVNGTRYLGFYTDTTSSDISTIGAYPLTLSINSVPRLTIASTGAATFSSSVTASSLIKSGGTSAQYLMADGSTSTIASANVYTQTFFVPNTGGTSQWTKLGTWTAAQGGNVVTVQIDQHAGYNATTNQNKQVYIYMKTSNGSSVDANGFAADSTFWTEGLNTSIPAGDVIWESNAAGVAATTYTLYVFMYQYTNGSQYTVTTRGGTWANVETLTAPSGTTGSSTILLSENRFVVNNVLTVGAPSGNVLIGTTADGGYKLDVNGTGRFNGTANTILTLDSNSSNGYTATQINYGGAAKALIGFGTYLTTDGGVAIRTAASTPFTIAIGSATPNLTIASTGAATFSSSVTASSLIKSGGTSAQYLMADGSVSTLTNPVTGTGTTNYVPKFTSASAIGNSQIFDNGTNVGIGTAGPSYRLDVVATSNSTYPFIVRNAGNAEIGGIYSTSGGAGQIYLFNASSVATAKISTIDASYFNGGNLLIGTTTDSGYKLAVNGTITSANYSYLSTYGYGATQLRTYEISTGTSVSDNQVFNLYLGRFGNGYHRITLWSTGYGTDSGNYFDITRTWSGTPYIITNGGLIMGGAQYTIHWAGQGSGQYDLFIKWYAGMPTGYSNVINYAIQSNTGSGYTQFDYPGGVTVPTLDGSNLVASRMTIQYTTGNVGIGTTAPSYKLDVAGDARFGDGNNFNPLIQFAGSGRVAASPGYSFVGDLDTGMFNPNLGNTLAFTTAGSERLRIDSGGNVGIGTTNPGGKLEVNFTAAQGATALILKTSDSVNANATIRWQNSSSTNQAGIGSNFNVGDNGALEFLNGNTTNMIIRSSGNVGIGTTAPSAYLDVKGLSDTAGVISLQLRSGNTSANFNSNQITLGYANTADYRHAIKSRHNSGAGAGNAIDFYIWNNSLNASDIATNHVMSIDTTSVGIGTTVPTEKLHVDGSTLITYNNSFQSTNSVGNKAILARVSPTSGIINYAEYATATNLNGFVIGSDDARVKGNITGDSLEFITNTSTRMTILSGGNVGINTTTPGSTLHVIGDVLIQTGALGVGVNPNATDGRIDASNDIVAFSTSDRRLKENITPIANALEKVRSLTGVEFDWKEETKSVHGYEGHDVGVIAQDVQAVLPEAVRTNDSGYLSVRYEKMIALLVEAMKEQQAQIDELKAQINDSPR